MGLGLYFGLFGGDNKLKGIDVDPRYGKFQAEYRIPHSKVRNAIDFGPCSDPAYTPDLTMVSKNNSTRA